MRLFLPCLVLLLIFSACRKEEVITFNQSAKLQFSADTILFDTVFTSVGSTSRRLKVYNPNVNAVRISQIVLEGGSASAYRININGQSADKVANLELAGKDSLNIFIKVLINPGAAELPFIVADSIHFLTNGNRQSVQLRAYGQNARFLNEEILEGDVTWDKKLPYVIYNSLLVSEGAKLTIQKGTRVYFHKDSKLFIAGSLNAQGTPEDTITFSGDRLEKLYRDEPGQWGGLHFISRSKDNILRFARIKNAVAGIRVDSLSLNANPKLILSHSIIKNMQVAGLLMYNADVSAFNNLVYNCGQFLVYGALGGRYNFKQNTLAGVNFRFSRQTPAVYFSDHYEAGGNRQTAALYLRLVNNIIWGSNTNELLTEQKGSEGFNLLVQNNLLKTSNSVLISSDNILNPDPQFTDAAKEDYRLKAGSPALRKGSNMTLDQFYTDYLRTDLLTHARIFPSSLGCYEFK